MKINRILRSRRRRNTRRTSPLASLRGVESLECRRLLAVTASFSSGVLQVVGDNLDNNIEISRTANGGIVVNDGEVAIAGGTPSVNNTTRIFAFGLNGNDSIVFNEVQGALPQGILLGGSGNDTLITGASRDFVIGGSGNDLLRGRGNDDQLFGGSGNDTLLGDRGNDRVLGQTGADLLIWNNGDGSDVMDSGSGDNDTVQVNGANGAGDDFSVDANGNRVRFQRTNLGLFALDIGTTENLDINAQGGNDRVTVSSLTGVADLQSVDVDGGEGNDNINATALDALFTLVRRGGGGNDVIRGGAGDDILLGEQGADVLLGGGGDDLMFGGAGNDVLLGQDGRDELFGGAGNDILLAGSGDDILDGGSDFDILDGGSGTDIGVNGEVQFNIP